MAVTKEDGPIVVTGQRPQVNNYQAGYNPDYGPSLAWGGMGQLDTREDYQDAQYSRRAVGWVGNYINTIDAYPAASSNTNIAAAQIPTAGTALTLRGTSVAGMSVLASPLTVYPAGNAVPQSAIALDGPVSYLTTGTNSAIWTYNPQTMVSRAVTIVSVNFDSSGYFLVSGYDIYGYPMSEKIVGGGSTAATGKKAFKFITSIVPTGTFSGSNVSVGTTDIIGAPLRVPTNSLTIAYYNSALVTATTGWTVADGTSPATSSTGDVRGTYQLQSAADGSSKRFTLNVMVNGNEINTIPTGVYGVSQA